MKDARIHFPPARIARRLSPRPNRPVAIALGLLLLDLITLQWWAAEEAGKLFLAYGHALLGANWAERLSPLSLVLATVTLALALAAWLVKSGSNPYWLALKPMATFDLGWSPGQRTTAAAPDTIRTAYAFNGRDARSIAFKKLSVRFPYWRMDNQLNH